MFKSSVVIIMSVISFLTFSKPTTIDIFDKEHSLKQVIKNYRFVDIGKATFSVLFWDIYQSKLSTTSGKYPIDIAKDKLLYEIHYLANISSEDLIKRTVEQWQHLGVAKTQYQQYLTQLKETWPDIEDGDKLSLLIIEKKSLFYFNDNYIGDVDSAEFGPLFLDIWLSKNTSEPSLRRGLLGQYYDE